MELNEFHIELKIVLKITLNTLFKGVFVSPTDYNEAT